MLDFVWKTYEDVVNGFVDEDLKTLRRAVKRIDAEKSRRKKLRQRELVGMRRIDKRISLERTHGSIWLPTAESKCFIA